MILESRGRGKRSRDSIHKQMPLDVGVASPFYQGMQSKPASFWILYFVLAALILLRLLPFVTGFGPLWGVAHLLFLPVGYTIAYGVLGVIALALPLWSRSTEWGDRLASSFSQAVYGSRFGLILRTGFVVVCGVLFWLFSMPTHFLGDGYPYIANLGSTTGNWVKWTEGAAMQAVLALQSLLGGTSEPNAETAFRIISVFAGVISFWFYFLIARIISERPIIRLVSFAALALTPASLLFFGYVETYPLLWAPVSGMIYFGLRYAIDCKHLVWACLCLVLATVAHLLAFMFYPALLFLVFSRGRGLKYFRRYKVVLLGSAGIVAVALTAAFVYKYTTDLSFENYFLWPFKGKPIDPDCAILSPAHLLDILNLILLVFPLLVLLACQADRIRHKLRTDTATMFLSVLSVVSLLFLLVLDPSLSMPRDWDLFAICLLPPTIMTLRLLPERKPLSLNQLGASVCAAALIFTLPYLLVHLKTDRSIAHIKTLIDSNPRKSMGTMALVGTYYRNIGDRPHADSVLIRMQSSYPNMTHARRCRQLIVEGKLTDAVREFNQIAPDPFSKDYHLCLSALYASDRQLDSALTHALAAVQLQKYYDQSYATLGTTYMLRNELEKALDAFRFGYALNSKYRKVVSDMATIYAWQGRHDSTLFYAQQLYDLDSTSEQANCLLARGYYYTGDRRQALYFARRYFELGRSHPEYDKIKSELLKLMPELSQPAP